MGTGLVIRGISFDPDHQDLVLKIIIKGIIIVVMSNI
jgi:hypothetical protein